MVVGSLDGWSPMVAMNAVYFKGLWEGPFEAEPFEMNRPFVFAICDDFTGVVVFLGAVADSLADGPAQGG